MDLRDGEVRVGPLTPSGEIGLVTPYPAAVVLFSPDAATWQVLDPVASGSSDGLEAIRVPFAGSGLYLPAATELIGPVEVRGGLSGLAVGLVGIASVVMVGLAVRLRRPVAARGELAP